MADEDDYETMPQSATLMTHMIAGGAAGILEHVIMYPVDIVKTRMQTLIPNKDIAYRSISGALRRMIKQEGVGSTFRGVNIVLYGAGPAHAVYFATYEYMKRKLATSNLSNHVAYGLSGAAATVMHDTVMTPIEVIKQRMQMYQSPYKTCTECGRRVLRAEGIKAFYRSYSTQLIMNIPFQSIHFIVYEHCSKSMNPQHEYSPLTHLVAGSFAGAFASLATTPLDVAKTLLNTQEKCAIAEGESSIGGMWQALKAVYRLRGIRGYFIGVIPRVVYVTPSTAISWSVYEFFKHSITNRRKASNDGYVTAVVQRS